METLSSDYALQLLAYAPNSDLIQQIIKDSAFDDPVCVAGANLLITKHNWDDQQLWLFLVETKFPQNLINACILWPKTAPVSAAKSPMKIIEASQYNGKIIELLIKFLDKASLKKHAWLLADKSSAQKVQDICWAAILSHTPTEKKCWNVWKKHPDQKTAEKIAPFIKKRRYLAQIIKQLGIAFDFLGETKAIMLANLQLEQLQDGQLIKLAQDTEFNRGLMPEIIKFIKSEKKAYQLYLNHSKEAEALIALIPKLKSESSIINLIDKFKYREDVMVTALGKINDESQIMDIWGKNRFDRKRMVKIGPHIAKALRLATKNENELISLIKFDPFNDYVCVEAQAYFHLEARDAKSMLTLLYDLNFHESACQLYLPTLHWEKKTQAEAYSFLKAAHFHKNVGDVLIPYISKLQYLLEIAKEAPGNNSNEPPYWTKALSAALQQKSDKKIIKIMANWNYRSDIKISAINAVRERASIFALIQQANYQKDVFLHGLARLEDMS